MAGRGLHLVVGVAALVTAAGLAACSSGSSDGHRSPSTPSSAAASTEGDRGGRGPAQNWAADEGGRWRPVVAMAPGEPRQEWNVDVGEPIDDARVFGARFVYVTRTGASTFDVVARSLAAGDELWRRPFTGVISPGTRQDPPMEGDDGSPPVIGRNDAYVLVKSEDRFRRLDPRTGREIWHLDTSDLPYTTVDGRGPDGCIGYTKTDSDGDSRYHCIGLSDGKESWSAPGYLSLVADHVAYLRDDAGISAVDAASGKQRWNVLGAQGSMLEVDGTAVVCDTGSVYGVDRDGFRQWDLVADSPSCYPGPAGTVLVKDGRTLHRVRVADGKEVGPRLRIDKAVSLSSLIGDRYLVGTDGEKGHALDLKTGKEQPFPTDGDLHPAGTGAVLVHNTGSWAGPGPGSWSITGRSMARSSWDATVGWTHPDVLPTEHGMLVIDLGFAGNLWFGTADARGPKLSKVAGRFARSQHPPKGLVVDGTSVLGVPFGTPVQEARERLTKLLGPPSLWNDHVGAEGYPKRRLMWGSLEVEVADVGGRPQVVGWRDWARGQGSGWALPGGLTAWSGLDQVVAAGYTGSDRASGDDNALCRDGVCFHYWYGMDGSRAADQVEAPPPADG